MCTTQLTKNFFWCHYFLKFLNKIFCKKIKKFFPPKQFLLFFVKIDNNPGLGYIWIDNTDNV